MTWQCTSSEYQIPSRNSTDFTEKIVGSVVSFRDLTYTVRIESSLCSSWRATKCKTILHDVSGLFRPGLNAIMGSTGSGKTTLLDALAMRKDPNCISGKLFLNGTPIPKNYKYLSGYVIQSNLFEATVTVREALWFCANLRLPTSVTYDEKAERIQQTMGELDLLNCADTKIGNEFIRGISSGEKKRTSIATELILEPRVFFLDEPTTGLDAATALSVVSLLKRLGDRGHTVICSIHQPRYSIYKMLDSITLLSHGHMVYQGHTNGILKYFEDLGYICEIHDNPADFCLDILNGCHKGTLRPAASNQSSNGVVELAEYLKGSFNRSSTKKKLDDDMCEILTNAAEIVGGTGETYATGFSQQVKILFKRDGRAMARNPQLLFGSTLFQFGICICFGLGYFQVPNTPDKGVQNRLGFFFFVCSNLTFSAVMALGILNQEREIYRHEHISGYYSMLSYFVSKVAAYLVILRTGQCVIYAGVTYWMVGLKADPDRVLVFLLTIALCSYANAGMGFVFSIPFHESVGALAVNMSFVFMIVFSGLLVSLAHMSRWVSWLQYFSLTRYSLAALSTNELRGEIFTRCENATHTAGLSFTPGAFGVVANSNCESTYVNGTICQRFRGESFLHGTLAIGSSVDNITDWDLWQNIVALGCLNVGLYTLAYILLSRLKTYS